MKHTVSFVLLILMAFTGIAFGQQVEFLTARPLTEVVTVKRQPVQDARKLFLISWGGDIATILAEMDGIFQNEGLDVELVTENNFAKQVESVLRGETPYLRGTMGMINAATEVFKREGLELIVIYQMTWSTGGDTMTVRQSVNQPSDLRGKTIALQLYGPHMDYVANILNSARVPLSEVNFKWFRELTLPTYDTNQLVDPVSAFAADSSIDAVMAIIPDALMLTSGGKVGTGSEGSVKGSEILLDTSIADRIIADVYVVRSDYFQSNRGDVQNLVRALLRGQEALRDLQENKANQQTKFSQLMSRSADILLDSPTDTENAEAMLADCTYVGHTGNVQFFTGQGTLRNLKTLTNEIQTSFRQMGLMTSSVPLVAADWNYGSLGRGLKYATTDIPVPKPKFDPKRAAAAVERRLAVETDEWEGATLFDVEINFDTNQDVFPVAEYASDFEKALGYAQTYGGSLIVVEGYTDPSRIVQMGAGGTTSKAEIGQYVQAAKNLSYERAVSVRSSFIQFAKNKEISLDESRFLPVGRGIDNPKHQIQPSASKAEWDAKDAMRTENRRVLFLIKRVEAESDEFIPIR